MSYALYFYPIPCSLIPQVFCSLNHRDWFKHMNKWWQPPREQSDAHQRTFLGKLAGGPSGLPAGPGCTEEHTDRVPHPSGPCLCRALQCLRLGDDVCDAADRFRHSRVCLWVLQSCRIQQKLGPRERWERLHEHESTRVLLNSSSVQISDVEHSRHGLARHSRRHTGGSGRGHYLVQRWVIAFIWIKNKTRWSILSCFNVKFLVIRWKLLMFNMLRKQIWGSFSGN